MLDNIASLDNFWCVAQSANSSWGSCYCKMLFVVCLNFKEVDNPAVFHPSLDSCSSLTTLWRFIREYCAMAYLRECIIITAWIWQNIIQIMNAYECNGTNIFMRWKMKCSIQRGEAELNGTVHFSPNENICSIARMKNIHYLFYITAK